MSTRAYAFALCLVCIAAIVANLFKPESVYRDASIGAAALGLALVILLIMRDQRNRKSR